MCTVAAAPLLFDHPPTASPELALVDADLAAQLRADLATDEPFRPRHVPRPEHPTLVFDAVVRDLDEGELSVEPDELPDDVMSSADADVFEHDVVDDVPAEETSAESFAPPVLEALPTPEEQGFELPDYIVAGDDAVDPMPDYIVLPEEEEVRSLPEYVAPANDDVTVDDAVPDDLVHDDEFVPDVVVEAATDQARSSSDYPVLPDLDERSEALEETEAALRRIREHMVVVAPSAKRRRRMRRRFTVVAGVCAVATVVALAAELQLGVAHLPGIPAF